MAKTSPGSETLACYTQLGYGNSGDPQGSYHMVSMANQVIRKQGSQITVRESDDSIVPVTRGNAR